MDPYELYPRETEENEQCPASTPLLCGSRTLARGLCVATEEECDVRTSGKRAILQQVVDDATAAAAASFAYDTENLGRGCYVKPDDLQIDYEKNYEEYDSIPGTFSMITYNIWGLAKNEELKKLFTLRKDLLLDTLIKADSDCICLQEMSEYAYNKLKHYIDAFQEHGFVSEAPYKSIGARGRSVDVYYMSRYRPKRLVIYGIRGVLGYTNCFMVVEYPNLVIFNMYSQAGSVGSVGQEKVWIHYSRCRYDIMNMIYDMIQEKYKERPVIITGDFNFHLDGTEREWPETEMLRKLEDDGFIDSWKAKNDGPGYTENTNENYMRWNHKFMEKMYRFDGILYKPLGPSWKVHSSQVFGKGVKRLSYADSDWFVKKITSIKNWNKPGPKGERLQGVKENSKGKRILINASDHFGVRAVFATPSRKTRRNRKDSVRLTRSASR
jgi:exonuclease III